MSQETNNELADPIPEWTFTGSDTAMSSSPFVVIEGKLRALGYRQKMRYLDGDLIQVTWEKTVE